MEGELLQAVAKRLEVRAWNASHGGGHLTGEGRRQPGDNARRSPRQAALDQGLGPNEDVKSFDEIGLEPLPGAVGDLQADEVRRAVA